MASPVMTLTTTNLLLFADKSIRIFPYTGSRFFKKSAFWNAVKVS
jgi:hypothetical protein